MKEVPDMSYKAQQTLKTIVYHVLVMFLGFIMVYPLLWMIMSSFKPTNTVFTTAGSLIPSTWTLDNYLNGLKGFGGIPFTTYLFRFWRRPAPSFPQPLSPMRSAVSLTADADSSLPPCW